MFRSCSLPVSVVVLVMSWAVMPAELCADAFDEYSLTSSFGLPQPYCVFDVLSDGRIVALSRADLYVEDAVGAGTFTLHGTLPNADMPAPEDEWGAAFIRVSPDGGRIAVGNNGGGFPWDHFEVGVFDFPSLSGDWFELHHYDAAWYDDTHVAIAAGQSGSPSIVTVLDTTSSPSAPENPTVIENIGGYSGGIAFDALGNLYTGNAFRTSGPNSDTGWVKVFENAAWTPALTGGSPLDFETTGTLVVDILSAASLGFDAEGNLHVGGGDWYGETGDINCAALVRASAVSDAVAGLGPVDPDDPTEVRRFDPDESVDDSFYSICYNRATAQLLLTDPWTSNTVYAYAVPSQPVPAVSQWGMAVMTLTLLTVGTLTIGRNGKVLKARRVRAAETSASATFDGTKGETVR